MDLDLTPKKYTKPSTRRRRRSSRVLRNWNNPFQIIIFVVAALAFIGTTVVSHVHRYRQYKPLAVKAAGLRKEAETLMGQAVKTYDALEAARAGVVLKKKSPQEQKLDQQLAEETKGIDSKFHQVNACYKKMPPQYQTKGSVEEWFVAFTRECIEHALARKDYEQARLWFNASPVNAIMMDVRPLVVGNGSLEISAGTNVDQVAVWPLKSDGPRLVPCDPVAKGSDFPLEIPDIAKGSYMVWVTRQDGTFAPYPVFIEHGEKKKVTLEVPPSIPKGMAFVPGGECYCGGPKSPVYRYHKVNLPSFFIKKKEVTVREYLEFWKSLDDPALKESFMSRIRFKKGAPSIAAWDAAGKLRDHRLSLDYPVVGITVDAAKAYCRWLAQKQHRIVRLPTADEWEKAARGVDGRTYPWGYDYDAKADLTLTSDNLKGKAKYPYWAPPGTFSDDVSVYGVLDMAGNVREMTSSIYPGKKAIQIKGGSASAPPSYLPCSYVSDTWDITPSDVGFRYVMVEMKETKQ